MRSLKYTVNITFVFDFLVETPSSPYRFEFRPRRNSFSMVTYTNFLILGLSKSNWISLDSRQYLFKALDSSLFLLL